MPTSFVGIKLLLNSPRFVDPPVYPFLEICKFQSNPISSFLSFIVLRTILDPTKIASIFNMPLKTADPVQENGRTVTRGERLAPSYPNYDLYPPVCPQVAQVLYPTGTRRKDDATPDARRTIAPVRLGPAYPIVVLNELVYPHNLSSLYSTVGLATQRQSSLVSPSKYPFLVICTFPLN